MSLILLTIGALGIAVVAWSWWQSRLRKSNVEKLKQATAALNRSFFEGSGYRIDVTECADGSVQAIPNMTSEQTEEKH